MIDPAPRFTLADAERFGRELFGIVAKASPLDSERDQNFALASSRGRRYVLKVAKSDEEGEVLDFQNAALRRVAERAPDLDVSRLIPARDGEEMAVVRDDTGRSFFVRLVGWIDGELFVDAATRGGGELLRSLGEALARLDAALTGFRHPAMGRHLQWDLRHIDLALEHLPLLSREQRQIVDHFRVHWERVEWPCLRKSVIYNDANDRNVLVREGRVVGFLDFGDIVHSALVCDLAIAIAYAMLDQPDPLGAAVDVATAYHRSFPLQPVELEAVYPLAVSRLCMSACYAAHHARVRRGDEYQTVTAGPAWRLLPRLAAVPVAKMRRRFARACAPISGRR